MMRLRRVGILRSEELTPGCLDPRTRMACLHPRRAPRRPARPSGQRLADLSFAMAAVGHAMRARRRAIAGAPAPRAPTPDRADGGQPAAAATASSPAGPVRGRRPGRAADPADPRRDAQRPRPGLPEAVDRLPPAGRADRRGLLPPRPAASSHAPADRAAAAAGGAGPARRRRRDAADRPRADLAGRARRLPGPGLALRRPGQGDDPPAPRRRLVAGLVRGGAAAGGPLVGPGPGLQEGRRPGRLRGGRLGARLPRAVAAGQRPARRLSGACGPTPSGSGPRSCSATRRARACSGGAAT